MITGRTWRAKTTPSSGSGSSGPNRNWTPALLELMTALTPSVSVSSTARPKLQRSTANENATRVTMATPTVRQLIARRLMDSSQAAARTTSEPPSPHRICVTATHPLSP
jgi:hypothetical protein